MRDVVRRVVVVRGHVQGVGFRYSTLREATRIGVSGEVTNLADGSVGAFVEGAPSSVDELVAWFRAGGPSSAVVDAVEVQEAEPLGSTTFEIV